MSKVKRLGDIVNFKRGYDLPAHQRKEGSYPVVSSSGISGYHSEYKVDGEGIVTGRYGTLGEMHYVNGKYWPHNTALYVTDFKGNYPKYVYYLLKCLGNLKTSDKSAVPGINRNDLHELFVPYVAEGQEAIAAILSSIDQKIEINNRINAELEAMAKTLYDYWFVQFDFPDENGKPYKSSGGKMLYSKELKREIPADWEVYSVGKILASAPKTKSVLSKDFQISGNIPVIDQSADFICGYTNQEDTLIGGLASPCIVFGDHTRILKFVNFDFARGANGTQILISNDLRMPPHLFYQALSKVDLSNYGYARHFKFLKQALILLPTKQNANNYNLFTSSCYLKIKQNLFENQRLATLRDWLLPMLMNGQVRVESAADDLYSPEQDAGTKQA